MSQQEFVEELLSKSSHHIDAILEIVKKFCSLDTYMNQGLKEFWEGNILVAGNDKTKPNPKLFSKIYNLYKAAENATNVLEIGVNSGFSCMFMLMANPDLKIIGVDICSHGYVRPCVEYLNKHFNDRITLYPGDSSVVMKDLIKQGDAGFYAIDLFHIDGCHLVKVARDDLNNCHQLAIKNKSIVIFDDTQIGPLKGLWNQFVADKKIKVLPKTCTNHREFQHEIGVYI